MKNFTEKVTNKGLINCTEEERFIIAEEQRKAAIIFMENAIEKAIINKTLIDEELFIKIPTVFLAPFEYQRILDVKRAKMISSDWDKDLARKPIVAYDPNHKYPLQIIEGQHTFYAFDLVERQKGVALPLIMCEVKLNLDLKRKSKIFTKQNNLAKKVTLIEQISVDYKNNDEKTIDFVNTCLEHEVHLKGFYEALNHKKPDIPFKKVLGSIKKTQSIYLDKGKDVLNWVLTIIDNVDYANPAWYNGELMLALASFYNENCKEFLGLKITEILKKAKTPYAAQYPLKADNSRGNRTLYANYIKRNLK
jgi:hypothetical protein